MPTTCKLFSNSECLFGRTEYFGGGKYARTNEARGRWRTRRNKKEAVMAERGGIRLSLASLPDGALAHVLSFGEVPDLVVANNVRDKGL